MENTRVLSIRAACKVGESSNGRTDPYTKENTATTGSMVEESTFQFREKHMKEIGKMACGMAAAT
jgi:hypothetical protein